MYKKKWIDTSSFYKLWFFVFTFSSMVSLHAQEGDDFEKDTIPFVDTAEKRETFFVDERKVPDSIINRFKNDDAFWYANNVVEKKKETTPAKNVFWNLFRIPWIRNLCWTLFILCCTAIIIWFLASSNIKIFYTKPKLIVSEKEPEENRDIFSHNLEKDLKQAIQSGEYRTAVRLLYLQVLKKLAQSTIIHYSLDKTNSDYLLQLQPTAYYKDFFKLTRDFEYVWYGQFTISETTFQKMREDFISFKDSLPH
jgi:hypothetical protein